jgi:hypothetical protein
MNEDCGPMVVDLLEIRPEDGVLEMGFRPRVIMHHLSRLASAGHVAGIETVAADRPLRVAM